MYFDLLSRQIRGPTWAPLDPGPGVNSPGVHQGPVSGPADIYMQIVFLLVMVLFLSKNKFFKTCCYSFWTVSWEK